MSVERIFIAKKLATQLYAVEAAIEQALTASAQFAAALPEARTQAGLSAVVGQDVFDSAIATIAALNVARGKIVDTHNRLDQTRIQMGMRPVAFGSACNKPHMEAAMTLVETKAA